MYAEAKIKNYHKQDRSIQSDTSTCTQWMYSPHYIYKTPGIHMVHSYNTSDVRVSYPHPATSSTLHVGVTKVVVMKAETEDFLDQAAIAGLEGHLIVTLLPIFLVHKEE